MSDSKKYYYIRLKEGFFESNELLLLQSQKDGYIYSDILLKLYLRSLRSEGRLMVNEVIPMDTNMLATVTRHSVLEVKSAIEAFRQLGLIEVLDDGSLYMSNIQSFSIISAFPIGIIMILMIWSFFKDAKAYLSEHERGKERIL